MGRAANEILVWYILPLGCICIASVFGNLCNPFNPHPFDPSSQVCCDGKLYDRRAKNGTSFRCCQRDGFPPELYDEWKSLCCGPYLVPRFDGRFERTCCKGADREQFPGEVAGKGEMCCGGNKYSSKGSIGCCDAMSYDKAKAVCCYDQNSEDNVARLHLQAPNDNLYCCGTELYNDTESYCYDGTYPYTVKPLHIRYYKGQQYDKGTQVPCYNEEEETVTFLDLPTNHNVQMPIKYKCCNKNLIDSDKYSCCRADKTRNIVEHSIIQGDQCCGNYSVRGSSNEICCNGVPNRRPKMAVNETYQCCGTEYTSSKRCCNGKLIPLGFECCGGKAYDTNSPSRCCGDHVYDTRKEVCCTVTSSKKYPKSKEEQEHTHCCSKTQTSYSTFTHRCTDVGIEKRPRELPPTPNCPFCKPSLSKSLCKKICKKKNVYVVTIKKIQYLPNGSRIVAQMSPKGIIKIRMPFRCPCLKEQRKYLIFTNRKVKTKRSSMSLRIKKNDMMVRLKRRAYADIEKRCSVLRKIIKTMMKLN